MLVCKCYLLLFRVLLPRMQWGQSCDHGTPGFPRRWGLCCREHGHMPAPTNGFAILMREASHTFTKADEEQPFCVGVHTLQHAQALRCVIALCALAGGSDGAPGSHS